MVWCGTSYQCGLDYISSYCSPCLLCQSPGDFWPYMQEVRQLSRSLPGAAQGLAASKALGSSVNEPDTHGMGGESTELNCFSSEV